MKVKTLYYIRFTNINNMKTTISLLIIFILLIEIGKTQNCTTGQYLALSVCYSCHYSCKNCDGGTLSSCTQCDTTTRYLSSQVCLCIDGYIDNGTAACQKITCNVTCKTCNNTATTCTTCQSTNFRTYSSNACPCISKYYSTGLAACLACHYSCATCTVGAASTNCVTCNSLRSRTISSTSCPCNAGYYDVSNTQQCATCSYKCLTCSVNSTNCLTCGSNRGSAPGCLCNAPYYDDGSSTACLACHYSCSTCDYGVNCTTCNVTRFRMNSSLTTYCACISRYYDGGSAQTCLACHQTCLTCSNSANTNCLTCNSTAKRELSGTTCVCSSGYYETSTTLELCSACNSRCTNCLSLSTSCTSCDSNLHRQLVSNQCTCVLGYYQDTFVKCQLCHYSCEACVDANTCSNCSVASPANSTRTVTAPSNLCVCPNGYFDNGVKVCSSCSYTCLTCTNTATKCLSCPTSSFRTLSNNTCPCNQYYYDSGAIVCASCNYSCNTCVNGSACSTCNAAKSRNLTGGQCLCYAKYYDNGVNEQCQNCLAQCKTCTTGSTCTSCQTSQFRSLVSNLCPCIQRYYLQLGICKPCLYHCSTCSNNTYCLTCNSTMFRVANTTNDYCSCMTRYYDDGGGNQLCRSCKYSCLTCTNAVNCTSCSSTTDFRTIDTLNQCPCTYGYYESTSTTVICTICPYHCETCSNSTGTLRCLTCDGPKQRLLNSTSGICYCGDGFYNDNSSQQCQACHYSCKTCTSYSVCTSCDTTLRTLSGTTCICFQRYFDNLLNVTCSTCDHSCSTCTELTSCSSCNATRFRTTSTPFCKCMAKYYDDGSSETCLPCKYQCQTCVNGSECSTCNPSKFRSLPNNSCPCDNKYYDSGLSSEQCLACQYSCGTCNKANQCLTCETVNFRTLNSTSKLCACSDRYMDNGLNQTLCIPCLYRCYTCQTLASNCISCNSSANRVLSSNQCNCKQYYYDDGINENCPRCNHTCETCTDGISCDTCNITKFRVHNITTDLCSCSVGYYDDLTNQICPRCHLSCLTCTNILTCATCSSARNRTLNSSLSFFNTVSLYCVCIYRHYDPSPSLSCQPCHYSCQVCTGGLSTQCSYCSNVTTVRRYLNSTLQKCLCLEQYFDDGINQQCQSCDVKCQVCTDRYDKNCTKCTSSYYLLANETSCYAICPTYYFANTTVKICSLCSQYCLTCINGTVCTECQTGKYLYKNSTVGICFITCPIGTFPNSTIKQCTYCTTGCSTCTNEVTCISCLVDYYKDSVINLCYPCNSLCNGCTGPSLNQCLSCHSPLFFKNSKCYNLTCVYGQFVDPLLGCQKCSQYFSNSLTCNKKEALECSPNYHLINGTCANCLSVPGYKVSSSGSCLQICGDGIRINLQCDDGNTLKGDGCSSSCTIEEGWTCNNNSICSLVNPLGFSLVSVSKYGGENKVILNLKLSLPVRLKRLFTLVVQSVQSDKISWDFIQNQDKLQNTVFIISYLQDIQNKNILLTYTSSRLLMNSFRRLQAISLNTNFIISSFPPAVYYEDGKVIFYKKAKQIMLILSVILILLCLILIPNKMPLHSLTLISIPGIIFISGGLLLQNKSDWIKFSLMKLKETAFIGGFSFGKCCTETDFFNYRSELVSNSGIVLILIIVCWLVYGVINLCQKNLQKTITIYSKYYLVTIQLLLSSHLTFGAFRALTTSSLDTQIDAYNLIFSVFVCIYLIFMLGMLWRFSISLNIPVQKIQVKRLEIHDSEINKIVFSDRQDKPNSGIEMGNQNDQHSGFDDMTANRSKLGSSQQIRLKKSIHNENSEPKQQDVLINELSFDFINLYSTQNLKSRFFLPFFFTKMFFFSIVCAVAYQYAFLAYIILAFLQIIFIFYMLAVRPFKLCFTNFRIITTQLAITGLYGVCCYYSYLSRLDTYSETMELVVISTSLGILSLGVLFIILQHILAWRVQIWSVVEPCLISFKLRVPQKIYDIPFKQKELIKVEHVEDDKKQSEEEEEIDAFYARMLKREKLNKQYERERAIGKIARIH